MSTIPLPTLPHPARAPRRFARMPEGAELLSGPAYKVLGAILLSRRGNSPYVERDDEELAARLHRHPNHVRRYYPEIERAGLMRRARAGRVPVFVLTFDLAGPGESAQNPSGTPPENARPSAHSMRAGSYKDPDPEDEEDHQEGDGVDLPIAEGKGDAPAEATVEAHCARFLARAADGRPSEPGRTPEVEAVAQEAADAIAPMIGTRVPGMVRRRLLRALEGPDEARRRLLECARFVDDRIAYGWPPDRAGAGFIERLDGTDLAWPHHPESEAARDARRLADGRPREPWGFSPTLALGGPPPPATFPAAPPPPASFGRPARTSNTDTPETAWAKFEEFRRRRAAALAVPVTAHEEPPAALRQEHAAGGREKTGR